MERPAADQWHFWIDRGGTFTDIVAWRDGVSNLLTAKVRSEDPNRSEDASIAAIRMVLDLDEQADLRSLGSMSIRMGTTVATNALLTRSGARTAVVLTAGLGDLLVLRDQSRPRLFELDIKWKCTQTSGLKVRFYEPSTPTKTKRPSAYPTTESVPRTSL